MASHELGVTLAVLFVLPALRPLPSRARFAAVGILGAFGGLSFLHLRLIGASMMAGATVAESTGSAEPGPLQEALALGGGMTHGAGLLGLALLAALAGLLGWWGSRERPALERFLAATGFAVVTLAAGAHQVGAALGCLVALALVSQDLLSPHRASRALGLLAAAVALGGVAWLILDLAHGASLRHAVRDLGGGPLVIGASLLRPPAIAIPALLGSAAVLLSALRGAARPGPRFLLLCIAILTVVRGLLAPKIVDRYMADVWTLWELLAGFAVVEGTRPAAARLGAERPLRWTVATVVALGVLLLPGTAPAETLSYLDRRPGVPASGVVPPMVADLRGAARFVHEHAGPGDRIAATDWLATYCYLGRVDLWLRSDNWAPQAVEVKGVPRDIYLGARVVPTLEDLAARRDEGPIWVVAGGLELYEKDRKLDPDLREFLRTEPAVWEATDGFTRVLRLEPRLQAAHAPGASSTQTKPSLDSKGRYTPASQVGASFAQGGAGQGAHARPAAPLAP
jgi:hypothetical protein